MDKAKNEITLATLEKHGGSTTFQVIMDVAEEYHCDVCAAALNSLKRKKAVEYEGMMLLLPNDADVVVSITGKAPAGGAAISSCGGSAVGYAYEALCGKQVSPLSMGSSPQSPNSGADVAHMCSKMCALRSRFSLHASARGTKSCCKRLMVCKS